MSYQENIPTIKHDQDTVLGMLERLDSAKQVLEKASDIENTIEQLNMLNIYLKRFGTLSELTTHLRFIERKMYMLKEYLTITEAADYLSVSISHIYKLTSKREFPVYKPNGKTVYIKRDDLNGWINRTKVLSKEEIEEFAMGHMQNLSGINNRHNTHAWK